MERKYSDKLDLSEGNLPSMVLHSLRLVILSIKSYRLNFFRHMDLGNCK